MAFIVSVPVCSTGNDLVSPQSAGLPPSYMAMYDTSSYFVVYLADRYLKPVFEAKLHVGHFFQSQWVIYDLYFETSWAAPT